jgi:hypothetical protein
MNRITRSLIGASVLLLLLAGTASAAGGLPGPFSTTGYTTNLVLVEPPEEEPYVAPSDAQPLPGGMMKFHMAAEGGGEPTVDDEYCQLFFGAPCQVVCDALSGCGVGGSIQGTFKFDEWGLHDFLTFAGPNHGYMTITSDGGQANMHFAGYSAAGTVNGTFVTLDGTGEFEDLDAQGTYTGNAGFVFTVLYQPSTSPSDPLCHVIGHDLKANKKEVKWELTNHGDSVTISSIMIVWPEGNGRLKKIELDGKIYDLPLDPPLAVVDSGWKFGPGSRRIGKDETKEMTFEFLHNASAEPSDYTIVVDFAEGCPALAVAFQPPSAP